MTTTNDGYMTNLNKTHNLIQRLHELGCAVCVIIPEDVLLAPVDDAYVPKDIQMTPAQYKRAASWLVDNMCYIEEWMATEANFWITQNWEDDDLESAPPTK
jgi:hypothetical protein